ncbi:MAG TPA: bifunctional phosphoribosylaminoimidazolecarboxamide formyltransferase/IMP cyclohydrolase [Actinomycetes bacterium]|jgi:phosphoribosylaminoimidazolecarboxamide formyltransferase/IMP cyclohydrolase|nr:bifunctional phosphoribosylaminoimidazolecarboxamide formyltransferase/IMP cyclohydrolase [Actinomycetes bacterium]
MSDRQPIRRALLSVYDKTGLPELAAGLAAAGIQLVSTGSTAAAIAAAGMPVTLVEDVTGFPECLDGRVKTLHPAVHAGLLADRANPAHVKALAELGIEPFDLLASNLYPFAATVAAGATPDESVEQIDIGGPAMVRAAAKNHGSVAVVVDPAGYPAVLAAVEAGGFTRADRAVLAAVAFAHVAAYDLIVADWMSGTLAPAADGWPGFAGLVLTRSAVLRYGENPHQQAALYVDAGQATGPTGLPGLAGADQLHGRQMSYNNYVDTDAAWRAAHDFGEPCVAIVKHANPCGIAVGPDIAAAHRKAHACDPVSAFGGVIATNRPVSAAMAEQVAEVFTEVVCAPEFEPGALAVLTAKKNIRLLRCTSRGVASQLDYRKIDGGMLLQTVDRIDAAGDDPASWRLAVGPAAQPERLADLAFGWRAARAVKSNAIVLVSGGATVGIGMGQVNRVDAARLAVDRAGERAAGAVAASDAFFPFPDGLLILAEAGVSAVVQPGGSVRDAEVIAAAEQTGITMYLTGVRHFAH